MKKSLPENAKIAKDAKETVQECVSEFISFITSEACEKCKNEKRKTINGEDILSSIQVLGFEGYGDILKLYLSKYRESVKVNGEEVGDMGVVGKEEIESESDEEDEEDDEPDQ
jgi:nuclear transcription Y subunit beta